MTYHLGARSQSRLVGVHPQLVLVVRRAIELTTHDFTVTCGLRSKHEQLRLFLAGASQLNGTDRLSRHQVQDDGWGHAVDLAPCASGQVYWDLDRCYYVAEAMRFAAQEESAQIRWGGFWGVLTWTEDSPETLVAAYCARKRDPFIDGVHFELLP